MADEWTLTELSKLETDTLRKSVIDTLLMESNIMQLVPWETIGQLATTIVRVQDLPSIGFRKLNEGFSGTTGHFEQKVENISLMGCYMDCDKAIARAKNTIADARAITQVMALKGVAYKFNDKFINGNPVSDPEEFKGLYRRVDEVYDEGFTDQKVNCACAGVGINNSSTTRHAFLDKLDELIYAIKGHQPDMLFMNKKTLLAVRSLLRREKLLDNAKDMFGRNIDMYSNCQLIDIGTCADQTTDIITITEDADGTSGSSEYTSIYAVKFGIGELLWGIQQYPLEVTDKGLLEAKPVYRTELDWNLGLALADSRAIGKLYGVIPDASA